MSLRSRFRAWREDHTCHSCGKVQWFRAIYDSDGDGPACLACVESGRAFAMQGRSDQ